MPRAAWPTITDAISLFTSSDVIDDPTQEPFADTLATNLSTDAAIGAVSLAVTASAGFNTGDTVFVGESGDVEWLVVTSKPDATHIGVPATQMAHGSGEPVTRSAVNWGQHAAAAPPAIQKDTGRVFIAVAATRTYDPPTGPRGMLDLVADLCSDPASPTPIIVTLSGKNQLVGTDIYLGPENNDQSGEPWRTVEFANAFPSSLFLNQRKSIQVSGPWGYSLAILDDVWQAACEKAGLLAVPQVAASINRGRMEAKNEHIDFKFAGGNVLGPLHQQAGLWKDDYFEVVERRKKRNYF